MPITDYPDWDEPAANAVALSTTDLTGTGLAKEAGGNLASTAAQLTAGIASTPLAKTADITGISSQAGWPSSGLAKESGGNLATTATELTAGIGGVALAKSTDVAALHAPGDTIAAELAVTSLTGTGLATHTDVVSTNGYLAGTSTGALVATAGDTIGKEAAAYLATGSPTGTPGGVPLLGNPVALYGATSVAVPGGASNQLIDNLAAATVTSMAGYLSYDILARFEPASGSTQPFATYSFSWYADSAATQLVYQEIWTCPGTNSGQINMRGTGPVRAAYLTVGITNEDATNAGTLSVFRLIANSRPAPNVNPDFRNNIGVTVGSYTGASAGKNVDGVLGYWQGSTPANGSSELMAGLYNGPCMLSLNVVGTSPDLEVQAQAYLTGEGATIIAPFFTVGVVANSASQLIYLPRSPLIVVLSNLSTVNSVTWQAIAVAANSF